MICVLVPRYLHLCVTFFIFFFLFFLLVFPVRASSLLFLLHRQVLLVLAKARFKRACRRVPVSGSARHWRREVPAQPAFTVQVGLVGARWD